MLAHKCMNRKIACNLANAEYEDENVNVKIFEELRGMLTPEELAIMSGSKSERVLHHVCTNPKSSPAVAAKALYNIMQDRGTPVYYLSFSRSRKYEPHEIDESCILILPRKYGINDTLIELNKLDGDLATSMIQRFISEDPLLPGLDHKKFF
jgi:hypothetical protein